MKLSAIAVLLSGILLTSAATAGGSPAASKNPEIHVTTDLPGADGPSALKRPAPVVFFDIAGPDGEKQKDFYLNVFGWLTDPMGNVDNVGVKGALRQDPAAKVIYLGVPDVTAALRDIEASGGKTVMPRFEVKGVVVIGLFTDPAGNTMGLVEMKDDKPVVP